MKNKINLMVCLFVSFFAFSQIWINDLEQAKKLAKASNKIVIIDFNATWCKPCKIMESEFWYNKKYKPTLDKFIVVPVDIDSERSIAGFYSVSSIPNVKLIDYKGNVIHEFLGYEGAKSAEDEIKGFPEGVRDLYENLEFKDPKKPTDEELLILASSYQALIQVSSTNVAKRQFAQLSNQNFTKCSKTTKNTDFLEKAELSKSFNNVLTNSPKKAIKNIDLSKISDTNKPYALYILVNANYADKNNAEAERLLAELEKTGNEQWISYGKNLQKKYSN